MSLSKNNDKNNFYPVYVPEADWHCDWLWSTHRGCQFNCIYCSSKEYNHRFKNFGDPNVPMALSGEWMFYIGSNELKRKSLPFGGVFVNPYCDMFNLTDDEIKQILYRCRASLWNYSIKNRYNDTDKACPRIFQTKNPAKYFDYLNLIPGGSWLGTTIETDILYSKHLSKAPSTYERWNSMFHLKNCIHVNKSTFKKFITIEPIMVFDVLAKWIKQLKPDLVFIGADSGKHNLPEPSADEVKELIFDLREFTVVECKKNLERIIGKAWMDGERLATQQMKESYERTD